MLICAELVPPDIYSSLSCLALEPSAGRTPCQLNVREVLEYRDRTVFCAQSGLCFYRNLHGVGLFSVARPPSQRLIHWREAGRLSHRGVAPVDKPCWGATARTLHGRWPRRSRTARGRSPGIDFVLLLAPSTQGPIESACIAALAPSRRCCGCSWRVCPGAWR